MSTTHPYTRPPSVRPLGESNIPNGIRIRKETLTPSHNENSLPHNLQSALNSWRKATADAISLFKELNDQRNTRYDAMCHVENEPFTQHVQAIERLQSWTKDKKSSQSTGNPLPKLTKEDLAGLCLSQNSYNHWLKCYHEEVQSYKDNEYKQYLKRKDEFVRAIDAASNKGHLDNAQFDALMVFLNNFQSEMEKWEQFVPSLPAPLYETVLDEIFYTLMECLEDAESLWRKFHDEFKEAPADFVMPSSLALPR